MKKGSWILFPVGAILCLTPLGSPGLALALGAILALLFDNPFAKTGHKLSKWLLQICVVLLGFSMDLKTVLAAGREGIVFAAITILSTFALGWLIGRWLKVGRMISTLVSAGTAICGGSAIAAVGAVTDAEEGDMTVAIGTIFLLNAIALYVFPPVGHLLGMNSTQFGTWAGIAIHDISSVVGASSRYSVDALQTATAVKLSRALWIIPVAAVAAYIARRAENARRASSREITLMTDTRKTDTLIFSDSGAATETIAVEKTVKMEVKKRKNKMQIPWFIGLFLLASIVRTLSAPVAAATPQIAFAAKLGFTLTLFLIGAGLSMKTLRAVGWRPLVQGVVLWVFISTATVGAIVWMGK